MLYKEGPFCMQKGTAGVHQHQEQGGGPPACRVQERDRQGRVGACAGPSAKRECEVCARAAAAGREGERILAATREMQRLWRESPVIDPRSPDEILGYDENGLPA